MSHTKKGPGRKHKQGGTQKRTPTGRFVRPHAPALWAVPFADLAPRDHGIIPAGHMANYAGRSWDICVGCKHVTDTGACGHGAAECEMDEKGCIMTCVQFDPTPLMRGKLGSMDGFIIKREG